MAESSRRSRVIAVAAAAVMTLAAFSWSVTPASGATAPAANGACKKAQRNIRQPQATGTLLACVLAGKTYRWKVVPPRHGDPCTVRAANYPGTLLDCVPGPGAPLRWRNRGSVWNPYRLNEPVEMYSLEGSRYQVVLTQWNSDITEVSKSLGVDLRVPGVAFVAWRIHSTLLSSSKPTNANRASEASVPFSYVRTDATRDDQSTGLSDGRKPGSQPSLNACRDGRIQNGFPAAAGLKDRLEKLTVGETGSNEWCFEAPADQQANVILESGSWFTRPELSAKYFIYVYMTGTPR